MPPRLSRLVVVVLSFVLAPMAGAGVAGSPATAAQMCEPTHPTARIVSLHVPNVVPGTFPAPTGPHPDGIFTPQRFRLDADNPCNGSGPGCPNGAPETCAPPRYTTLTISGKRAAGSGASCAFRHELEPLGEYVASSGLYSYAGSWSWAANDVYAKNAGAPRLTNRCAGAYDVVATLRNEESDGTLISGSNTYRQSHSFLVRRPARLTATAGPATVRVGSPVQVGGRLTRADWDQSTNPQVAYPGQPVLLQRATQYGIFHTLTKVRTDRRGHPHARVKALRGTRCYRWVFKANATTQGRTADGVCLTAR